MAYDEDQLQRTVRFAMPREVPNDNNDDNRTVAIIHTPDDENEDNDGHVIHIKTQICPSEGLPEK